VVYPVLEFSEINFEASGASAAQWPTTNTQPKAETRGVQMLLEAQSPKRHDTGFLGLGELCCWAKSGEGPRPCVRSLFFFVFG
jgi:hypothetical protein